MAIPTCNRRREEGLVTDGLGPNNHWNWQCCTGEQTLKLAALSSFHEHKVESLTKHFHSTLFWFPIQLWHYSHIKEVDTQSLNDLPKEMTSKTQTWTQVSGLPTQCFSLEKEALMFYMTGASSSPPTPRAVKQRLWGRSVVSKTVWIFWEAWKKTRFLGLTQRFWFKRSERREGLKLSIFLFLGWEPLQ